MSIPYLEELGLVAPNHSSSSSSSCSHGYSSVAHLRTPGAEYPYNKTAVFLVECLKNNIKEDGNNALSPGMVTFSTLLHTMEVQNAAFINADLVKACVMIGTDLCRLLCGPHRDGNVKVSNAAKFLAQVILLMEEFLQFDGTVEERRAVFTEFQPAKMPKVVKGWIKLDCHHCIVRFYDTRNSCTCLNQAKEQFQPCSGICCHCNGHFLNDKLFNCGGCHSIKYCSKNCQVADWPSHKNFCKDIQKHQRQCSEANKK